MPDQSNAVGCSCGADTIPGSIHTPGCDGYVRQHYRDDFEVGDEVAVDGQPGTIMNGRNDQYIYVRERAMSAVWKCHPTWRLEIR